ncbi:transcriptional repressor (plasmid) [Paraburkholderia sprentiae WSM5005]|uniref:Ferric uptake regulation protein n=1 Tax=Paraburkholderia sprentiae WSM5005 TaxID=754502 RepID=A0A1I9YUR1_9BURK|nr:Fur family transcriptional regulator [Paraburkholderia sprentiae]APA89946.2 transcriptional repressor [Paraburkholderia sprentiae WSM5005]
MPNPQSPPGDETPAAGTRRFTPLRRRVLGLLVARGGSATAYQLLEDLNRQSPHAGPPTIYRALQFLIREGLVRHVSTTSTFRLTEENQGQHEIFAVCMHCHSVRPLHNIELQQALLDTALTAHFEVQGQQTEIKGICEDCNQLTLTKPSAIKK